MVSNVVLSNTNSRGYGPAVDFLTWTEAIVAAVLLAVLVLYLVFRDR
jgi:hypothetical protein